MVEIDRAKWILISNYESAEAAEAAAPMVLVGSMSESFGMKLEVIGEGQTIREVT